MGAYCTEDQTDAARNPQKSHPAVGLGMSEPVEPIRQNELAAVMIVHLQLSSQCRRYEPPGL